MQHVESQFSDQQLKLQPLQWECRSLATGPPGKSRVCFIFGLVYHYIPRAVEYIRKQALKIQQVNKREKLGQCIHKMFLNNSISMTIQRVICKMIRSSGSPICKDLIDAF